MAKLSTLDRRRKITCKLIDQLQLEISPDDAIKKWWWSNCSTDNNCSLRLTWTGYQDISKLLKPYIFEYETPPSMKSFKRLMNLPVPYYFDIREGRVMVFSEKIATTVNLYGSFRRYLDLLK